MYASVDYNGKKSYAKMGSYGIGVSRLVGALIEANYDDEKEIMKWPTSVVPYQCVIIPLIDKKDKSNLEKAEKIYKILDSYKIDTIIDDTEESIGSKTKKFNMIGIPNQIILGKKSTETEIEFKQSDKQIKTLELNKVIDIIR